MLDDIGGKVEYENWIGASKAICLETKAIWGLCIALWYAFPFFSSALGIVVLTASAVFCSSSRASRLCVSGGRRRLVEGTNWAIELLLDEFPVRRQEARLETGDRRDRLDTRYKLGGRLISFSSVQHVQAAAAA